MGAVSSSVEPLQGDYRSDPGDWSVERVGGGWAIHYDGLRWPSPPKPTRKEAEAYADRLARRWPDAGARVNIARWSEPSSSGQKGGPWRYRYGDETGVIRTRRLADAKAMLRSKLNRKRLPNGITWNLEQCN